MKPFFHRYGVYYCAEQVDLAEGCEKLFASKAIIVCSIRWLYGVGPKVNMRLFSLPLGNF